ncbi:crotonobetainyl-CoA:carnitine CoA-transferase CaiB-like acyl-CoA transferase [Rhodovulum bhavnagarense]|uniref:Crotonobetainyl-CoA:carnitine CoA-transferase CaiB-like acyl-CoA transferase n=1 Tax=Rhodovulum bhavnagarense TaxID=992286 RepID=A0A4R2R987_9RHOB|nr:CaiB/BaiF CoA-transferase family protein [Rhodovulum bhavnagarense]TCP58507.1 crotonobetainyl-CoA:carnitine CoA-transferase CaiB-like acyl-CoA transferase [Rhodovulum bhavnagarense]
MRGPLTGVKVLELARILAGPWIGQTLADLGATVIKVESPAGDDTRSWGPPFIDRPEGGEDHPSAAYFYAANRGKRSIAADFRDPGDLALVRDLALGADVLIENFKLGGLVKFGLDYASLAPDNPGLVYCSITGFGQDGPYAARAGYDYLIQGMSGLMSVTGTPEGEPMKVGVAVTDIVSGLYGVIGIQAALAQRAQTGKGQHVDMSLLDCATAMMANQAMNYLATGHPPGRMGNQHPNIVPYQVFAVADGAVIIAAGNDGQFQRLCEVLECGELASDPRFRSNRDRVENRAALIDALSQALAGWTRSDLLARLETAVVPSAPINDMADVFADPQVISRGLKVTPEGIAGVRTPLVFSDSALALDRSAPRLDADGPAIRAKGWDGVDGDG